MNDNMPKNIRARTYKSITTFELLEKSAEEWNKLAVSQRQRIFLKMFGFDPENDKEAQEGIDRHLKKK